MKFQHYEVETGSHDVIRVILQGSEANVKVMDDTNFHSYRSGRAHEYFGGHYQRSPAVIRPPHGGRWNVVVDLGGFVGSVSSSVQVLRAA